MSEPLEHLEKREDLAATSDPALQAAADRGEANLLSYNQLYQLWERQQWSVYELDFSQDRVDWHERIPPDERFQRMYGLSSFFIGEQRVEAELGPMMRAMPDEDMRIFLSTQIADEARHVGFFNVARDEHRHVAFGARFLREMAQRDDKYREAIVRTVAESGPAADGVLTPPWYEEGVELFGYTLEETREFAMKALERRLKVIGLAPVS